MISKAYSLINRGDLKGKVLKGTLWSITGMGAQKFLQLASNLILTRLLFPEAFGLMALVTVFIVGVHMLSDMGVRPSIIQADRADDPDFLNTAWTLQVIRGIVLWALLAALAYPLSLLYQEPELAKLLWFCGINAIFLGCQSICIPLANRKLQLARLTIIKIGGQIAGIAAMVTLAILMESVWALAIGTVIGAFCELCLGHTLLRGHKHKLRFHKESAARIFHFGKWIFWSTIFSYLGGQGIRAIEGTLVTTEILGMIAIAGTMSWAAVEVVNHILRQVLFPALSIVNRQDSSRFKATLTRIRLKLLVMTIPIFALLSLLGNFIINLLYDDRYLYAGPLLAILALSGAANSLPSLYQNALLALGDSKTNFTLNCVSTTLKLVGMYIGFQLAEVFGMLAGVGAGAIMAYFAMVFILRKRQLIQIKIDLISILVILTLAYATFQLNIVPWL